MREIIARWVCVLTVAVVIALSFLFASAHNPRFSRPVRLIADPASAAEIPKVAVPLASKTKEMSPSPAPPPASAIERGRVLYAEQNCATCHAIAGEGNPRSSLDGVGARWTPAELREWITGTGAAGEALSASIAKRKRRYESLPSADLDAIVVYLVSLPPAR